MKCSGSASSNERDLRRETPCPVAPSKQAFTPMRDHVPVHSCARFVGTSQAGLGKKAQMAETVSMIATTTASGRLMFGIFAALACGPACKRDPFSGVIGV